MSEETVVGTSDMKEIGGENGHEAAPKSEAKGPDLLPEEGFKGWICVVGAFICLFCSFGFLNAYVHILANPSCSRK